MLDRTIAPPFVQSTSFDLITPKKQTLSNGIDLFFIPGGGQEVLKIDLIFPAGRWFESNWGVSHFTVQLLSKGTSTKSSFEIAQLFDLYGAHLEVNAGLDFITVSIYSLGKYLEPVLALLQEILTDPVFPEKELDQAKAIYIQNLKVNLEKTSFLASKAFRKTLFGEGHPYGKEIDENDVAALTKASLVDHFKKLLVSPLIFVSGKIEAHHYDLISRSFQEWKGIKGTSPSFPSPTVKAIQQRFEKEDSVQSSIRMGRLSVQRTNEDYAGAIFVAHVLGGYFGSRLMKNIREEKGLTYGIHSSIHPLRNAAYLVIGTDINKEHIDTTFDEIRKELKRLRSEPISTEELDLARNHFIGSLQSEITTPFAHADKWKTIQLFDLPADYYRQIIKKINTISKEEILRIGEQYFHEQDFIEVAVG
jgi:zinc protease